MAHADPSKKRLEAFKENLLTYTLDLGGLIAGFLLAEQLGIFKTTPWAIALYPAIIGATGVIGGLSSGRLQTSLHLGTAYPRFTKNTRSFNKLFEELIVVTMATSLLIGLISIVFGTIFWGITVSALPAILAVVVSTMAIGLSLTLINTKIAFESFKKGWDPHTVAYPIMTTVADVFVTLFYVLILDLFFFVGFGEWVIALLAVSLFLFSVYLLIRNLREPEFLNNLKDFLIPLVFVVFIANVTGTILKGIARDAGNPKEMYIAYPAMIDMVGDLGSFIGSTTTTKLALGLLKPSFSSIKDHLSEILSAWGASMLIFCVLAVSAVIIAGNPSLSSLLNLLFILLATNIIACASIITISYGMAVLTFKKGWNPETYVIPIELSLADSIASIALLIVLMMML